jgi:multidrug efflux pump
MARFFIDRPIFAWVVAIVIMLAGLLAIRTLPIAQYPAIAPTAVEISATYPGASAKTLEDTVTQVIEQKMKGIDHLSYMSSTSDSSGMATIRLTFDANTNPDIAQVQVQNKLQLAMSLLPQEVQKQGVQVSKASTNFLMVVGFYSEDGSMSRIDLSDYVAAHILDVLSRVDGVGDVTLFGSQYAMRVWLDPAKLDSYKLMPADVAAAIQAQNAQISAGQLGGTPAVEGQQLNATISAQSRLQTPEQFGDILLKVGSDGSAVRLKDVARLELGSENYDIVSRFNGKPAAGLAVKLSTGANALDTAAAVRKQMNELARIFPPGMQVVFPYDTTPFVRVSIEEVVKTLIEAIILVFLVMYLFLQDFRATLIPTIAVPVVLLGTFGVLAAFGFSINTLTMFGTVLAIGLLVDDAIVVVENVERVMREEGLSPKEATRKSMDQITGALVGIAMVLSAVFVPMAFFGGSTGVIYRQFSITVVSAMVLSVLVALILTPALCATMLKPLGQAGHGHQARGGFFGWFNRAFDRGNQGFQSAAGSMLKRSSRYLAAYALIVTGLVFLFWRMPTAFLPDEDQGFMFTMIQLPPGAAQGRTLKVIEEVERHFLEDEKATVMSLFTVAGFSFAGQGQNMGIAFIDLKDWSERNRAEHKVGAVVGRAMAAFSRIKDAMVFAFTPPAVVELGNAQGFDLQLQDRAGLGHDALMAARNQFLGMAAQNPKLVAVRPNGQDDTPQYQLVVDQAKAGALGLSLAEVNAVLSSAWGGAYVNDFIDKGRVKKVFMQGEAASRMLPADLDKWHVRNAKGDMVSFSSFASARWTHGSPRLERYNGLPAMELLGQPAPGMSSGVAMREVEDIADKLPPGIGYQWTGLSYQERLSGSQAPALYALSTLVVFLCLAALYESWSIPFAVLLVVPLGVIGALLSAGLRGLSNDVYFQVGLLTTIGLSAKNAILIVEFAKELQTQGMGLIEATLHAARLRLRPILMTSLAFILGVLPLAASSGAGSGAQNAIGTGVMGGMISATVLGTIFVPLFYVLVRRVFGRDKSSGGAAQGQPSAPGAAPAIAREER